MANVLKNIIPSEKGMMLVESSNTLVFRVDNKASKDDIKTEIEKMFDVKVASTNTQKTIHGYKKAYVRLADEHLAIDVMTKLGLM